MINKFQCIGDRKKNSIYKHIKANFLSTFPAFTFYLTPSQGLTKIPIILQYLQFFRTIFIIFFSCSIFYVGHHIISLLISIVYKIASSRRK